MVAYTALGVSFFIFTKASSADHLSIRANGQLLEAMGCKCTECLSAGKHELGQGSE